MLHYKGHARVGGKIAQVGSRLVDMAAQKMANDFFERFRGAVIEKYPPATVAVAPLEAAPRPGWFARLVATLRRILGLG